MIEIEPGKTGAVGVVGKSDFLFPSLSPYDLLFKGPHRHGDKEKPVERGEVDPSSGKEKEIAVRKVDSAKKMILRAVLIYSLICFSANIYPRSMLRVVKLTCSFFAQIVMRVVLFR